MLAGTPRIVSGAGVTIPVPPSSGGTGTTTVFTQGSVVFAGATGVYTQDNANFFWDDTNNFQGIGTSTPVSRLEIQTNALGVTQVTTSGLTLRNTTAAAAGAQQVPPGIRQVSNGWATATGGSSQTVEFQQTALPVQGTSAPSGTWKLQSAINGGAYTDQLTVDTTGLVTAQGGMIANGTIQSGSASTSSNLWITGGGSAVSTNNSAFLFAGAANITLRIGHRGSSTTTLAANNSYASVVLGNMAIIEGTSGTHALIAGYVMRPLTLTDGVATTTNTATLYIEGAATGITPTGANYAFWSVAGTNRFGGDVQNDSRMINSVSVSSAGTLTLASAINYVFSGTTTTWTLPAVSGNTGVTYLIKNRGSGAITLNSSGGGNDIYDTSAVSTLTINAGSAITLVNDGTYWLKE